MTNNTNQVELLTKENVRLYEENMKLKLMLGIGSDKKRANTRKTTSRKNTNNKAVTKKKETNKPNTNLSEFQKEREAKKAIVATKRNEKVPVPEIAKMIGQSEPTVRNYIRELRVEGKIAK